MQLPPFLLEDWFHRYKAQCRYNLTSSDVDGIDLHELLSLADNETRALWDSLRLGYSTPLGHPLLRAEIAQSYSGVEADHVHVFAGTTEAIFVAINSILRPGDHAVVIGPTYQLLADIPAACGADVDHVEITKESGWSLDIDQVRSVCRANTRLLLINAPNNPTGSLPSAGQLGQLADLSRSRGAYLLVDEVYRGLEPPGKTLPAGVELGSHVITVSGTSKVYGLAGVRIGWVASRDAALRERLRNLRYWTTLNNSVPSEILALIALRAHTTLLRRAHSIVAANRAALDKFLEGHTDWFDWVPTSAGTTAYPWLRRDSAHRVAEALVQHSIFIAPSTVIPSSGHHLRIGLGRRDLPQGLDALSTALAAMSTRRG
jgi:aspartate/methionine/tyrosine aminotransferase